MTPYAIEGSRGTAVAPDGYRRLACAILVQTVEHATGWRARLDGTSRRLRVKPEDARSAHLYLRTPGFAMFAQIAGVDPERLRKKVLTSCAVRSAADDEETEEPPASTLPSLHDHS